MRDQNTRLFFQLPIWCVRCKNLILFQKLFLEPVYIPTPRHAYTVIYTFTGYFKTRWNISNRLTPHPGKCEVMLLPNTRLISYDNCRNSRAFIGLFLLSICTQTHEFITYPMRQQVRVNNLKICYCKKQINLSQFSCVCPIIDNEFRYNIVKVVYGSTRLSPRGSTATLTMS